MSEMQDDELRDKTCAGCEYFDAHHGDCLNRYSPRFQTTAGSPACRSWVRDSTAALGVRDPWEDGA